MANKKIIDLPALSTVDDTDLLYIGDPVSGGLSKATKDVLLQELKVLILAKANLISPALTGTPTAPTATAGTNSTQIATTAFIQTALAELVASSPAALNTLNEFAIALNNDPSFATTITNALAGKMSTGGGTFSGDISVPDEAYGVGWNGSLEVPTKNALYDKIETLGVGGGLSAEDVEDLIEADNVENTILLSDTSFGTITGNKVIVKNGNTFNPLHYGVVGDGTADDTAGWQACIDACILAHGTMIVPAPSNYYKITSTLTFNPNAASTGADNEVTMDLVATGTPRFLVKYSGASGTACFDVNGLRYSKWSGLSVELANTTNLIGFDLDTKGAAASFSNVSFTNCNVVLGNANGQKGWRVGHVSGNGGDISSLVWVDCQVYGSSQSYTGTIGWHIEGSNTLQNTWICAFGALLDKMYSNNSGAGAAGSGNGGSFFYGIGTSRNNIDIEIANNQSYLFSGGRFESGERVLLVGNSNVSPSIVFQSCEINDYTPADGILFYVDMPCFLGLYGVNIQTGPTASEYTANMIKLYGGGGGTGRGRLILDGGSYEAANPCYDHSGNEVDWDVYVRGVGRQNSTGVNTSMMTDLPAAGGGGASLTSPDFITDISVTESANTGDGTRQISIVNTTTGSAGIQIARNGENPWQFFAKSTNNNFVIGKAGAGDWLRVTGGGLVGLNIDPTSTLHNTGSFASAITTLSGNTTLDATHHIVLCNTASSFTITLPAASTCVGREYHIKKISADSNAVIVDGNGSETIDGQLTQDISTQWVNMTIVSNGTAWFILYN